MGQAADAKPEGRLIDLWDMPLTATRNPEHLKAVKGYIILCREPFNPESA